MWIKIGMIKLDCEQFQDHPLLRQREFGKYVIHEIKASKGYKLKGLLLNVIKIVHPNF
jgi:hypothetical protein